MLATYNSDSAWCRQQCSSSRTVGRTRSPKIMAPIAAPLLLHQWLGYNSGKAGRAPQFLGRSLMQRRDDAPPASTVFGACCRCPHAQPQMQAVRRPEDRAAILHRLRRHRTATDYARSSPSPLQLATSAMI